MKNILVILIVCGVFPSYIKNKKDVDQVSEAQIVANKVEISNTNTSSIESRNDFNPITVECSQGTDQNVADNVINVTTPSKIKEKPIKLERAKSVSYNIDKNVIDDINNNLRSYIIDHEGLRLTPYECLGSLNKKKKSKFYTIGYGHVIKSGESHLYKGISKQQAEKLLFEDLVISYTELLKLKGTEKLSRNERIALAHFIYALGIGNFMKSTIYKHIRNNNIDKIKKEHFLMWCRIDGKKNSNLLKMREFEYNLFIAE